MAVEPDGRLNYHGMSVMGTVAYRSPAKADRLSLFVFIDAFGWEL